jgi:hypothetical protein
MSSPVKMSLQLNEPKKGSSDTLYRNINTKLTLILTKELIYAYKANNVNDGVEYPYDKVHGLIEEESKKYSSNELVVIIKPTKEALYKNIVDVLDEMTINDIKKYSLQEMTREENDVIIKTIDITER